MIQNISKCKNCSLYLNKLPLFDNKIVCDVMWVGLSAKRVNDIDKDYPLKDDTNSGKLIREIEKQFPCVNYYKTNLVKCLPLNSNEKIRYPNKSEMNACVNNLIFEINVLKPKIIFLLGNNVSTFFNNYIKDNDIKIESFVKKIEHPSYIYIYKRKYKGNYIKDVIGEIKQHLIDN